MLHFKDYLQNFKSKVPIEQLFNAVVAGIILIVILVSVFAGLRSVSSDQYYKVKQLAQQQSFPETQNMAHLILMQQKISVIDFYRLMYAKHYESSRIQKYPAMTIEEDH